MARTQQSDPIYTICSPNCRWLAQVSGSCKQTHHNTAADPASLCGFQMSLPENRSFASAKDLSRAELEQKNRTCCTRSVVSVPLSQERSQLPFFLLSVILSQVWSTPSLCVVIFHSLKRSVVSPSPRVTQLPHVVALSLSKRSTPSHFSPKVIYVIYIYIYTHI